MKFTFLGTGTSQGVPVIGCKCAVCLSAHPHDNRLRSSGLLSSETTTLVFDTGPDFREQMLRAKVDRLDAVVFTHAHRDHVAGLDDVRSYNFLQKKDMPVYADAETLGHLQREFYYIFENATYPGVPRLQIHPLDLQPFTVGDIPLVPIPVKHGKMDVLGFRCGSFAYLTDASFIPENSMSLLEGVEYLVLNALRIEPHHSHYHLEGALELVEKLRPRRAFFIHISHLMGKEEDIKPLLPEGVELAWDGQTLSW
ncbi:MAG: MBL fold metallo-hydrolase [Bacteroidia bacterium]|nr:MBL fold metallo-hydrolase [Bacteroidia bacterium]